MEFKKKTTWLLSFFAVTVALTGKGNKVILVNMIVMIEITKLACVVRS